MRPSSLTPCHAGSLPFSARRAYASRAGNVSETRAPRPEPLTSGEPVPGDPRSEFGKKLRAARIRAGLTHAEVAEQAGLTQQYVSVVEGGRQNITLSTMIALARVTGHEVRVVLRRVRGQPE